MKPIVAALAGLSAVVVFGSVVAGEARAQQAQVVEMAPPEPAGGAGNRGFPTPEPITLTLLAASGAVVGGGYILKRSRARSGR